MGIALAEQRVRRVPLQGRKRSGATWVTKRIVPIDEAQLREEKQTSVGAVARSQRKRDRKSTRLNSSHQIISYAVFCLKKKKITYPFVTRPTAYMARFESEALPQPPTGASPTGTAPACARAARGVVPSERLLSLSTRRA